MRMIDADALEELFREVISGIAKKTEMNGNLEYMVRASAMVIEMIKDAPTIEPEPHWIPTSKERPPQHQEIWITDVYGDVEVVYRGDGILWHSNGDNGYYFGDEIIAWMPANVPSPYQPEEDES